MISTYDVTAFLTDAQERKVATRWGEARYVLGRLAGHRVALLQRYGRGMEHVQHLVNFTGCGPFSFFVEHGCSVRVDVSEPFCPDVRAALIGAAGDVAAPVRERGAANCIRSPAGLVSRDPVATCSEEGTRRRGIPTNACRTPTAQSEMSPPHGRCRT